MVFDNLGSKFGSDEEILDNLDEVLKGGSGLADAG